MATGAWGQAVWVSSTGQTQITQSGGGAIFHGIVMGQFSTAAGLCSIYDAAATNATNATNFVGAVDLSGTKSNEYIIDAMFNNGISINVTSTANPVGFWVITN